MKVEYNISRIKYLLSLYKMTVSELLSMISEGLKNPITKDDIFSPEINLSYLKRIDKVFKKGLQFYFDPKVIQVTRDASIFLENQSLV